MRWLDCRVRCVLFVVVSLRLGDAVFEIKLRNERKFWKSVSELVNYKVCQCQTTLGGARVKVSVFVNSVTGKASLISNEFF